MVKKDDSKTYAFVTTFFSIIGFIIAILTWKKDKYVIFYAKQSLIVFILLFAAFVFDSVIVWIPIIGWLMVAVLTISGIVLWVISWVNALSGKKKAVPIIGELGKKINL